MKVPRRQFLHLAASAAVLPTISRIARAQAYPSRPIRLVIPFPPGGAYDAVGRPWADKMKHLLGTVVVENIGGASGSLGAAAVDRKSTRLNSSHSQISYAVFCLKKKKKDPTQTCPKKKKK